MNANLEELLHDSMEWFTAQAPAPVGLARKAVRHRRRRRATVAALASAGTAAAAAVAVAVASVSGTAGTSAVRGTRPAQTVAYVISRVQKSMTAAGNEGMVQYSQTVYQGPRTAARHPFTYVAGHYWDVSAETSWSYGNSSRNVLLGTNGTPIVEWGIGSAQVTSGQESGHETEVTYPSRTWWVRSFQNWSLDPPSCSAEFLMHNEGPAAGPDSVPSLGNAWPADIQQQLRCGAAVIVGRERVDGVNAIEIVVDAPAARYLPAHSPLLTLWVDPATYLPVREMMPRLFGRETIVTDFQWLASSKASLANLTIPAGFTKVPVPAIPRPPNVAP